MADISLIPKDYKEKIGGISIFSKSLILVIVLVVVSLLVYGGLLLYKNALNSKLSDIKAQIEEIDKKKDAEFEEKVISLEKVTRNLKTLFKSHRRWSNFFSALELLTIPQVSFKDFAGKIDKDGSLAISLSGHTTSYTYIAKQMVSFDENPLVSQVKVSGIALDAKGGINFNLDVTFLKDILLQ